jgi:predicted tellurium resistance membrane protein TerC
MTTEVLTSIFNQLVKVFGPIIANIAMKIIVREAKLEFTPEQIEQLNKNREKAKKNREDDAERAKA